MPSRGRERSTERPVQLQIGLRTVESRDLAPRALIEFEHEHEPPQHARLAFGAERGDVRVVAPDGERRARDEFGLAQPGRNADSGSGAVA